MNRRSFLRSVGVAVAVVLAKAGIVGAAPAEEMPSETCNYLGVLEGESPCSQCEYQGDEVCNVCDPPYGCYEDSSGAVWETYDSGNIWSIAYYKRMPQWEIDARQAWYDQRHREFTLLQGDKE